MEQSLDVTYRSVDIEIIPSHVFGEWPATSYRLIIGNYVPAMIMVSSAIVYYFLLVLNVFPASKPINNDQIKSRRRCRNVHNLAMALYSAAVCITTFTVLTSRNNELWDWHRLLCDRVEGSVLRPLSVSFTLSKIVEWADTAFLVWLGRSEPQFLHLYHHATTFWLFCFVMNMPGTEKMGMLLNSFVHTLMYWHYYRPWPKKLVPSITVAQIVQLAFVTYAYTVSPGECPGESFSRGRKEHLLSFLTPYAFVPVFLWLFIVFFVKRFVLKKPKTNSGSVEVNGKKRN